MILKKETTYKCDYPNCATAAVTNSHELPSGWIHEEGYNHICDKHGATMPDLRKACHCKRHKYYGHVILPDRDCILHYDPKRPWHAK